MESKQPHYRDYLEREYQSRVRRNPGYSLRAFARDIGMPVSKLSEVLRGLRGLAHSTAETVIKNLRLSEGEAARFRLLIDLHQTRSESARRRAEAKMKEISAIADYGDLSLERFRIIADWYHFSILEMTELGVFESDPRWIAGRLGVPTKEIEAAIRRLIEFGLLERTPEGQLRQTHQNLSTPSGIPSRELREHHSQILMKAEKSLHEVDIAERDVSAITLAFDSTQMPEIRNELKKLRRRIGQKAQERAVKDRVYCLAIQFFPMDNIKGDLV